MDSKWKRRFTWIDIDEIPTAFRTQPFPERGDRGDLGPLRASISRVGIINPILCRVKDGLLQVVSGYRRWLAAQVASVERIPVLIAKLTDAEAMALFREEEVYKSASAILSDADVEVADAGLEDAEAESTSDRALPPEQELETAPLGLRALDREVRRACESFSGLCRRIASGEPVPEGELIALADWICRCDPVTHGIDVREVCAPTSANEDARTVASRQTAEHSLRVAFLTRHIVSRWQWDEGRTQEIVTAALVYDLGMVMVAEDWAMSHYPLSQERRVSVHQHTYIGAELVRDGSPRIRVLAEVARCHHERWDGTGYPRGLAGRDVSLVARVVGIVDKYVALISERPHRPAFLVEEALQVIEESIDLGAFEPALARQFLDTLTGCPIGMRGQMKDGTRVRVIGVSPSSGKSHRVYVEDGQKTRFDGPIWFREKELRGQLSEKRCDGSERACPLPAERSASEISAVAQI